MAKRGRPPGAKNVERSVAWSTPSRCKVCGSTERDPYTKRTVQAYGGKTPEGLPYTHIVRRWTRCTGCGQHRVDMSFENLPPMA